MAQAEKIKRTRTQEAGTTSSNKGKETTLESKAPSTTKLSAGSELGEAVSGAKVAETKASGKGKGKKKVGGDEVKGEEKPADAVDVDVPKENEKTEGPGDEKKGDAGQDTKKSGSGTAENVIPTTDNATKPAAANVNTAASSETPTTTTDKKDDAVKKGSTTKKEKTGPTLDGKTGKPKVGVESVVADEGDVTTPKRVTKELPASPAKPLKEKLGLTVPELSRNDSTPSTSTVTGSTLSPLQKALENAEDETLMERMARLKIAGGSYQPPKDVPPPAQTDMDSEFECQTAPSGPGTPRSRTGRGSFNLFIRSDVPMSDDDEFFLDCDSASVSNFGGL